MVICIVTADGRIASGFKLNGDDNQNSMSQQGGKDDIMRKMQELKETYSTAPNFKW